MRGEFTPETYFDVRRLSTKPNESSSSRIPMLEVERVVPNALCDTDVQTARSGQRAPS